MRLLLAVVSFFVLLGIAQAEKRVALVIGNSGYKLISPLANPRNDARLMAATLNDLGFEVVTAVDVDYRGMRKAVRNFGRTLQSSGRDAVGLVYYAGHGVQARGANYLIPLGADIQSTADLELEAPVCVKPSVPDGGSRKPAQPGHPRRMPEQSVSGKNPRGRQRACQTAGSLWITDRVCGGTGAGGFRR